MKKGRHIQFYTDNGWEGDLYDPKMGIKEVAQNMRKYVKEKYPDCKFSIRIQRYAGGQSMTIALMRAPFHAFDQSIDPEIYPHRDRGYAQLSIYRGLGVYENPHGPDGYNNGSILTREAWDMLNDVIKQANRYNYDDSDGMIDYFSTKFYLHAEIGSWDKPFER